MQFNALGYTPGPCRGILVQRPQSKEPVFIPLGSCRGSCACLVYTTKLGKHYVLSCWLFGGLKKLGKTICFYPAQYMHAVLFSRGWVS